MLIPRELKSLMLSSFFLQFYFRIRGNFYLKTNSTSPYALGVRGL